jgi:hypothetical protein
MQCGEAQGFLISPPKAAGEIAALLAGGYAMPTAAAV